MHANHNPVALISIPKCGTHFLLKAVRLITGNKRPEIFPKGWRMLDDALMKSLINDPVLLRAHAFWIDINIEKIKNSDIKTIFIYRDPRDQIVSSALWIKKNRK